MRDTSQNQKSNLHSSAILFPRFFTLQCDPRNFSFLRYGPLINLSLKPLLYNDVEKKIAVGRFRYFFHFSKTVTTRFTTSSYNYVLELQSQNNLFHAYIKTCFIHYTKKFFYFLWCPYQKEYVLNTLETGWQQKIEL